MRYSVWVPYFCAFEYLLVINKNKIETHKRALNTKDSQKQQ